MGVSLDGMCVKLFTVLVYIRLYFDLYIIQLKLDGWKDMQFVWYFRCCVSE